MLLRIWRLQGRNKRVKPSNTPSSMNYFPGDLILDQKEERVKFYEHSIIICETMNREKIFGGIRDI
jgi:hypothetical protein